MPQQILHLAAAVIIDDASRFLVVRKTGSRYWIQPGGKIEPGETALAAIHRELLEEIGIQVAPWQLAPLGEFSDKAVNEPDTVVTATVFIATLDQGQVPTPMAEIEEIRWLDLGSLARLDEFGPIAPLTEQLIAKTRPTAC